MYVNMWFPVGGAAWEVLEPLGGGGSTSLGPGIEVYNLDLFFLLFDFCVWMKMRSASFLLMPPCFPYLPCQDRVYPPGTASQNMPFSF